MRLLGLCASLVFVSSSFAQCSFNDLVLPAGASVVGNPAGGCTGGGTVASGGTCVVEKAGSTCDLAECTGMAWVANPPACVVNECQTSELVLPPGAVLNGCPGTAVPGGTSCGISRAGSTCEKPSCSGTVWSTTTPSCTLNPCDAPRPGTIPAGMSASDFSSCNTLTTDGSCTDYICADSAYYHPIPFTLLCAADGTYDVSSAACEGNACTSGPYPHPDPGYPTVQRGGTGTAQTGATPGNLTPVPADVWLVCNAMRSGETCRATEDRCPDGWTSRGDFVLQCDAAGFYNASSASCEANTCQGGPVQGTVPAETDRTKFDYCTRNLRSGFMCEQTEIGYTTQGYLCNDGFTPTGDFELICDATSGTYSAAGSDCVRQSCSDGPVSVPKNAQAANFAACDAMKTGDTCRAGIDWDCDPGYTPVGNLALICQGTYNVSGAYCNPNSCTGGPSSVPANTAPANFAACNSLVSGQVCWAGGGGYKCDTGYHAATQFILACESDTYDAVASGADCAPNKCDGGPTVSTLPQGTTTQGFLSCNKLNHGEVCSAGDYSCAEGYQPAGDLTMACEIDGKYSVASVMCNPMSCAAGPLISTIPEHANAAGFASCSGASTGDTCMFTCDTLYEPAGSFVLLCTQEGYSVAGASCVPTNPCNKGPLQGTVGNHVRTFTQCLDLLSTQTCDTTGYTCDDGYSPAVDFVLTCINGMFDASAASCTANECQSPDPLTVPAASADNGFAQCNGQFSGDMCISYVCKDGHAPSTSFQMVCDESGTYSALQARCSPIPCSEGPSTIPQFATRDGFLRCNRRSTGDTCSFACEPGYLPSGTFPLICEVNTTYEVPTSAACTPKVCNMDVDCNGNADSVAPSATNPTQCDCKCRGGWSGPTCGACSVPFKTGSSGDCDTCHDTAVGYPDCKVCTSAEHCNSRASSVSKSNDGNSCLCTCRNQWVASVDGPCTMCPSKYTGADCNDCAAGLVGYPVCEPCAAPSDAFCSGRAVSVSIVGDQCTCTGCRNQWSGKQCETCSLPYAGADCDTCEVGYIVEPVSTVSGLRCTKCDMLVNCAGNALSVSSDGLRNACVCTCKNRWAAPNCSTCPPQFEKTQDCSGCSSGYIGKDCEIECSITAHCSSRARAVESNADHTACVCVDCFGKWRGEKCDVCPGQFAGPGCDRCAKGYVGYPTCAQCTSLEHCNGRAVSDPTEVADGTRCICDCRDKWEGAQCERCPSRYDALACDRCAAGYINYPTCTPCDVSTHCSGNGAVITSDNTRTICLCSCFAQWKGDDCSICPAPYDGDRGCAKCLDDHIGYPDCVRCSSEDHCSGRASSVVPSSDQTQCVCVCDAQWTGEQCESCPRKYNQTTCDKCNIGYTQYPECRGCSREEDCSGNGVPTQWQDGHCGCICDNWWSGVACDVCDERFYAGTNCDRCADASAQGGECGGPPRSPAPAVLLRTPSPTPVPLTPPVHKTDACSLVVCAAQDQCHTVGTCDPETRRCSNPIAPDGTSCDDGDLLTVGDKCVAGQCTGGVPCDGVTCTVSADPGCRRAVCKQGPEGSYCAEEPLFSGSLVPCDDGQQWTRDDVCKDGYCTGNEIPCTLLPPVLESSIVFNIVCNTSRVGVGEVCGVVAAVPEAVCSGEVACQRKTTPLFDTSGVSCEWKVCRSSPQLPAGMEYSSDCSVPLRPGQRCDVRCSVGYEPGFGAVVCRGAEEEPVLADMKSCTPRGCDPRDSPVVSGALVDCSTAVQHLSRCAVNSKPDFTCSGVVSCIFGEYAVDALCLSGNAATSAPPGAKPPSRVLRVRYLNSMQDFRRTVFERLAFDLVVAASGKGAIIRVLLVCPPQACLDDDPEKCPEDLEKALDVGCLRGEDTVAGRVGQLLEAGNHTWVDFIPDQEGVEREELMDIVVEGFATATNNSFALADIESVSLEPRILEVASQPTGPVPPGVPGTFPTPNPRSRTIPSPSTPAPSSSDSSFFSDHWLWLVIAAAVLLCCVLSALLFFCCQKRDKKNPRKDRREKESPAEANHAETGDGQVLYPQAGGTKSYQWYGSEGYSSEMQQYHDDPQAWWNGYDSTHYGNAQSANNPIPQVFSSSRGGPSIDQQY